MPGSAACKSPEIGNVHVGEGFHDYVSQFDKPKPLFLSGRKPLPAKQPAKAMAVADERLTHECEVYGRLLQRAWFLMSRFSEEGHSAAELVFAEQVLYDLQRRLAHVHVGEFEEAPFDEERLREQLEMMIAECHAGARAQLDVLLICCRKVLKWLKDWRQQMEPSEPPQEASRTTTLPQTVVETIVTEESQADGGAGRPFQAQYSHFDSVRRPGREIHDIRAPVRRRINRVTVQPIQRPELILICCTEGRDLEEQIRLFNVEGMGPHYMIQKNGAKMLFVEAASLIRRKKARLEQENYPKRSQESYQQAQASSKPERS